MTDTRNAHVAEPFMSMLRGFAETQVRMSRMTEREVHHGDERPIGSGWLRIETDPSGYSVWERSRLVKAARLMK